MRSNDTRSRGSASARVRTLLLAITLAIGASPVILSPVFAHAGANRTEASMAAGRSLAEPSSPKMRALQQLTTESVGGQGGPQAAFAGTCNSTWSAVTSPNSGSGANGLFAIAASAANDVWAVGDFKNSGGVAQTLAEHWNGSAWSIVPTPNQGAGDNVLSSVVAIGPTDAWAVGYSRADNNSPRQSLTEHWNGSSWTNIPNPQVASASNSLFGVGADASNDVWAVGRSLAVPTTILGPRGQTLTMHWNGSAWSTVATPTPTGATGSFDVNELSAVKVLAANDAWAVGDVVDYTGSSVSLGPLALIEHWNGTGWTQVAAAPDNPNGDFLSDISGTANDLWTVGGQGSSSTTDRVLTEHWNGTNWATVSGVSPDLSADLFGVTYVANNNVYAVGASAYANPSTTSELDHTLIEQWNGTGWSQVMSANPSMNDSLFAAASLSSRDVWAAGRTVVNGVSQTLTENLCTPPAISGISPTSGAAPGGTSVVITGSGFSGAVEVDFGLTRASSFHVDSDTQITATSPAHSPGMVDVTVTVQGTSATSSADQFTFFAVVPSAPTNVVVWAGEASATVWWSTPPSDGGATITSYTVTPSINGVAQPATVVSGAPPPTTVTISGLTDGTTYTISVAATNSVGTGPGTASNPVTPGRGQYHPLNPVRIMDTRDGTGGVPVARLGANGSMNAQITGQGGVPSTGVAAVVLNVTVTNATAGSYLTVWPTGIPRPLASNLNFVAGQSVPNLVEVAVGLNGQVSIYNAYGTTDVIFDVAGYVATPTAVAGPDGLNNPVVPFRILDTRSGTGAAQAPVGPNQTITVQVTGVANSNVPATGVAAVVLNVTVTNPTAASYLTVFPAGGARPVVSNLNFVAGQTVPNRVIVKVGPGGQVSIYNAAGNVDVLADIGGWFTDGVTATTGSRFVGVIPARILDTRLGTGGVSAPVGPNASIPVTVAGRGGVPAMNAATPPSAVVLNVTVTNPTAGSYLTVWPDGAPRPLASDLNYGPGLTVPNLVVVKLGSNGTIDLYNAFGTTDVIIDVVGWYG